MIGGDFLESGFPAFTVAGRGKQVAWREYAVADMTQVLINL